MSSDHSMTPSSPTAQALALGELDASAPGAGAPLAQAGGEAANPLRHVRVRLTVAVGAAELTVGELLATKAQQVLRLDRAVDQPVDVLLEGQVVARGVLVAVDDHFGIRITELPLSLDLPIGAPRAR
jgi:flagellar motor switch protein FliN/FliY